MQKGSAVVINCESVSGLPSTQVLLDGDGTIIVDNPDYLLSPITVNKARVIFDVALGLSKTAILLGQAISEGFVVQGKESLQEAIHNLQIGVQALHLEVPTMNILAHRLLCLRFDKWPNPERSALAKRTAEKFLRASGHV